MHLVDLFSSFVDMHPALAYGALFLGIVWEGELVFVAGGILVHLGVMDLPAVLASAVLGIGVKMILGYYFGVFLKKRFPRSTILKHATRKVLYFLPRFRSRPFWSIFVSKFIYGVNNIVLVFSGYMRVNFHTYCFAEAVSSVVWLGSMFLLGFFASKTAFAVSISVRHYSIMAIAFVVGFFLMQKILSLIIELIEERDIETEE